MKSHTFHHGKYEIDFARIEAMCDIPGYEPGCLRMTLPPETNFRAFHAALHEAEHADGVPVEVTHGRTGTDATERRARFLWRIMRERFFPAWVEEVLENGGDD